MRYDIVHLSPFQGSSPSLGLGRHICLRFKISRVCGCSFLHLIGQPIILSLTSDKQGEKSNLPGRVEEIENIPLIISLSKMRFGADLCENGCCERWKCQPFRDLALVILHYNEACLSTLEI